MGQIIFCHCCNRHLDSSQFFVLQYERISGFYATQIGNLLCNHSALVRQLIMLTTFAVTKYQKLADLFHILRYHQVYIPGLLITSHGFFLHQCLSSICYHIIIHQPPLNQRK